MNVTKQPARDVIASRQERVAYWRVRGLSTRVIAERLADEGHTNPRTGNAWDHVTIEHDCLAVHARWQELANQSNHEWVTVQLARYEAIFTAAMEADDLGVAARILKQQAELLGLNAPKKIDLEILLRADAEANGLDADELIRESKIIDIEERHALTG
jgi:hypothetical protein